MYRGLLAAQQAAMADDKVCVEVHKGKCPLGADCQNEAFLKKHGPRKLGKSYHGPDEIRRRVFNHVRFSSHHLSTFDKDEAIMEYMDANEADWLIVDKETWKKSEWDQFLLEEDAVSRQEDDEADVRDAGAEYEPPSSSKGKGKVKGKGKGKHDMTAVLAGQIARQTQNMMMFMKASTTCISALKIAADISRDAAATFEREKLNLEEGCET